MGLNRGPRTHSRHGLQVPLLLLAAVALALSARHVWAQEPSQAATPLLVALALVAIATSSARGQR